MAQDAQYILLVEDDPDVRESVQSLLEEEGYTVEPAQNGREALERVAASGVDPCLILLDLMMPVMNGAEFLAAFRSRHASHVPVVILSAWPREAAGAGGECDYLPKPLSIETLLATVEKHCRHLPA